MHVIEVEQLVKRYGDGDAAANALQGLTFAVPAGQFVAVTGPSGCGKSTLLNLLAGLDEPTGGRVHVAGRDLAALSPDERSDLRLRHIGFVFQAFNLLPTFTVLENVALPLEFLGVAWREATQRARAVLDRVHLPAHVHGRLPADLSGGEQQRTAIARALVADPMLVLADEPTGNLDSRTGQAILDLLSELNAQRTLTVVLVTHSATAAMYGDRTIELADGRILRDVALRAGAGPRVVSEGARP